MHNDCRAAAKRNSNEPNIVQGNKGQEAVKSHGLSYPEIVDNDDSIIFFLTIKTRTNN